MSETVRNSVILYPYYCCPEVLIFRHLGVVLFSFQGCIVSVASVTLL
jgi:hypothetical protein